MGLSLIRYRRKNGEISWGCLSDGQVHALPFACASLGELLRQASLAEARAALSHPGETLGEVEILSPLTPPCQIICQGKNYLDHLIETGVKPKNKEHNLLFAKADSSLASPLGLVKRPKGVRLLDYEIELGLVIGRDIRAETVVTDETLHEFVAGLVVANDISARDVQVPERQWFRGKSFRGFCPVGPYFYWLEKADFAHLYELELQLSVNGKIRQKASTAQLMHRPPETLALISRVFDLRVGDLVLTGTPGGVSMRVKPKKVWEEILGVFQSDKEKFARFVDEQEGSGRYLQAGDKIQASIRTADGAIDLGCQQLSVVD